ncbi:type I restriction enzyme subunit S [Moraxella macacae 0408225]|uniref:Type I restriction enzyme subunit S n=1 Tax=Moraxella macacae 0408225 TaxID=1230338 RepID=L2F9M3_9GAMM|nr:restriction endonuclease subunit S [Moraxella macacae]ELA09471.1 type I restriction enzyme subunit S [Moraxella macacae 0408225]
MIGFLERLLGRREVAWHSIEEIFNIKNGYTPSKRNAKYWENGTIAWFRMEDIRENGRILNSAIQMVNEKGVKGGKLFPKNSIIIATTATIGEHALVTTPYLSNQQFTNLSIKKEYVNKFDIRFIFYYCFELGKWCKNNTRASNFPIVDMNGFKQFKFPIPPLDVQNEIVKILDKFTALNSELIKELILRKKQYQYYRDKLLSFGDEVEWRSLGDVANYEQPTKYLVKSTVYNDNYKTPVLTAGKTFILGFTDETNGIYKASENPVIIFDDFTTANKWVDFDFKAKSSAMKMITSKDETQYLLKFIYYWLNTLPQENNTDHKRQWISNFANKKIPIPPIATQQKIVSILDKFETLTNSISHGLPKEIELRTKQYEYYRTQLLTFAKIS